MTTCGVGIHPLLLATQHTPFFEIPAAERIFVHFFRRVRKIAKSDYYLHVRLSVRVEQLGSHWTDFDKT
jgi:hypothetical protein